MFPLYISNNARRARGIPVDLDTSFGNSVDEGGGGRVKLGKAESAEVVLLSLTRAVADPTQRSQGWCPCGCRMWPGRRRERAEESRKEADQAAGEDRGGRKASLRWK